MDMPRSSILHRPLCSTTVRALVWGLALALGAASPRLDAQYLNRYQSLMQPSANAEFADPVPQMFGVPDNSQSLVAKMISGERIARRSPPLAADCDVCEGLAFEPHTWQLLPSSLIYRPYLANRKESRFSSSWVDERGDGALWDITLGGRAGIIRYGNRSNDRPVGWQLDIEGAVFPRLDPDERLDLVSSDFRFGVPLHYSNGRYGMRIGYYHLSSHIGDEYLLNPANASFTRINYSRDVIVWGHSYYVTDDVRVYTEVGFAVDRAGGAENVELQFGVDYAPRYQTNFRGAPFVAANALLREEVDYGGHGVFQMGWAWRGEAGHLFRIGVEYVNGNSTQWEFLGRHEEQVGFAMWYDF